MKTVLSNGAISAATTALFGCDALMSSMWLAKASFTPVYSGTPDPSIREMPKKSGPTCADSPPSEAMLRPAADELRPTSRVLTSGPDVNTYTFLLKSCTIIATRGVLDHVTVPPLSTIAVVGDA